MSNASEFTTPFVLAECPTFQQNLSALVVRQPDLADRLRRVAPPIGAHIITGRDGAPVVRLPSTDTTAMWLGSTSMPTVSAPAVLEAFADRGANVALPSMGSGYEPGVLAAKIADHCAVFVCENDIAKIALALAVADLSAPIRRGRVVIIDGDIQTNLAAFLTDNAGYEPPTQLFALPNIDPGQIAAISGAVRQGCLEADARRRGQIGALIADIAKLTPDTRTEQPRVLVLSVDAVGGAIDFAVQIERSLSRLGWSGQRCVPDSPACCGVAARLSAVRRAAPDLIIYVNCTPGSLRSQLPPDLPYVCWFLESAALPAMALEHLADCPHILAASGPVRDRLIARGARAETVTVLETGVDDTTFFPADPSAPPQDQIAVAILCDGYDTSPLASNIGLQSHELLWAHVIRLIEKAAQTGGGLAAHELLAMAERQADRRLGDKTLRDQFIAMITGRLMKTIVARTAIDALKALPGVALWGTSWNTHPSVRGLHRGRIPPPENRNAIYQSAPVVVLPFADAAAIHHVQEALAAGCCPLMRRPEGRWLDGYPQTRDILAQIPSFAKTSELPSLVRGFLNDPPLRMETVKCLRHNLVSQHRLSDRLGTMCHLVRPGPP